MKIVITGGDGFIGRHLSEFLSKSYKVYVIDNFRYGSQRIDHYKKTNIHLEICDIRDFNKLKKIVTTINPDIVYHLAAIHFIPECEADPTLAIETNVLGTVNLIRVLRRSSLFIFVSTGAIYKPSVNLHNENSAVNPCDIYGYTKLHAENYLNYFVSKRNNRIRKVRLFNVIGPGETNPHVLPVILNQIKQGNRDLFLGNVESRRDYIDVTDVVNGLVKVSLLKDDRINNGEVFNLGTSTHYSVKDLVNVLERILNEKINIKIDKKRIRKIDRPLLCADVTKITQFTNWTPKNTIIDTLTKTLDNPDFNSGLIRHL